MVGADESPLHVETAEVMILIWKDDDDDDDDLDFGGTEGSDSRIRRRAEPRTERRPSLHPWGGEEEDT